MKAKICLFNFIKVFLKYSKEQPTFSKVHLISKPSRRVYYNFSNLIKKKGPNILNIVTLLHSIDVSDQYLLPVLIINVIPRVPFTIATTSIAKPPSLAHALVLGTTQGSMVIDNVFLKLTFFIFVELCRH